MSDASGAGPLRGPADENDDRTRRDPAGPEDASQDATRRDSRPSGDAAADGTRADTRPKDPGGNGTEGRQGDGWSHVPAAVIERYDVVSALRAGGEAYRVLLARDRTDGSLRVVKLYNAVHRNDDVMRALQRADHSHVVRLHAFGSEPDPYGGVGWPWEVLEYIPGGSLADLLKQTGALGERQVRAVLGQLAGALHYLHTELVMGEHRGAAHRDVKPANVLLRGAEDPAEVVLADFGLVAEARHTRQTNVAAGSVLYQAPETFLRADRRPAQDWWSLGVMVVEMLTGENPNAAGTAGWSHSRGVHEYLTTHDVDLSGVTDEHWRLLCRGLLTREPEHRWGYEQVDTWLRGGRPKLHREASRRLSGQPLWLAGEAHHDLESVAEAMSGPNWEDARALFLSADRLEALRAWLRREFNGGGVPADLVAAPAQDARAAAVRAVAFRAAVLEGARPMFAGRPADAPGLCALSASSSPQDQRAVALISGELLRVLAYHPCATPNAQGHRRCGSRCDVLADAAEALPESEAELRRAITALQSELGPRASPVRDAVNALHNSRELRVLCLRGVLDPATVRRERLKIIALRRIPRYRACPWWMRLSAEAVHDRDSPVRLQLARVLLRFAEAEGLQELRKPDGRNGQRRKRSQDALRRTGTAVAVLSADLVTAAALFATSLAVLYVTSAAWLTWAGDRPEARLDRYAQVAADTQYVLAVPLAAVLLSVVLLRRRPGPGANLGAWLVVLAGGLLALTLWNDLGSEIRFPYVPGTDFKDALLKTDRLAGENPRAVACWAAVGSVLSLIAVVKGAHRRPGVRGPARDAVWARGLVIAAVLVLLLFPVLGWWLPSFVSAEPQELW